MDSVATHPGAGGSTVPAVPEARESQERFDSQLTELEQQILDFERVWWKYAGAKEQAIQDQFKMSATRYFQALNSLLDNPAALAAEPLLVKRLRRRRSQRQQERSQRRLSVAQ